MLSQLSSLVNQNTLTSYLCAGTVVIMAMSANGRGQDGFDLNVKRTRV